MGNYTEKEDLRLAIIDKIGHTKIIENKENRSYQNEKAVTKWISHTRYRQDRN